VKVIINECNVHYASQTLQVPRQMSMFLQPISHLLQPPQKKEENEGALHSNLDSLFSKVKRNISFWLAPFYYMVFCPSEPTMKQKIMT
jgi:hypothetical protein